MRIGLVSNLNSRGLNLDATLIANLLKDHQTTLIQYDEPHRKRYDLLIFFERVVPEFVELSRGAPWLFVNPEFLFEEEFPLIREKFGHVLCKTREALRICGEIFPEQAIYTGFIARDKWQPEIPRQRRFLHVAGNSRVKGTQAVIDAWKWARNGKRIELPLTVVADWLEEENLPANVTILKNISEDELTPLQNECLFHIQPSGTEGFSHTIHEALSVEACLLTLNAPPMDEIEYAVYTLDPSRSYRFHEATIYEVDALDLHDAVQGCIVFCDDNSSNTEAREEFLEKNEAFKQMFWQLIADFNPNAPKLIRHRKREFEGQKRVAFIGNFLPPYSTENDLAWTFRHLGHEVYQLQENAATMEQITNALEACDMLLWVHTHQFHWISDLFMEHILGWLKGKGKPSVGFHLDRFWCIPEREDLIGMTPFWKLDYIFTADGGNQENFKARGVNHVWLPPGIVERDCHYGTPKAEYKVDIAFVGAENYHACYPFRKELVEFLRDRYQNRFRVFNNVRGPDLNDLYASVKVVVGDCIFAGAPNYWSDRLPETTGRGGFLLHPEVEGLDLPVATYKPQNTDDLARQLEYYLRSPIERMQMRTGLHFHVRNGDTYTQRVEQMLSTVF